MATPGQMIQVTARTLMLPEVTVGSYYRAIREAGFVKTGGRGRSAARVSALDVARLLIAILASELVRDAPEAVRTFGELIQTESEVEIVRPLSGSRLGLCRGHRFEDAVVALLMKLATPPSQESYSTSEETDDLSCRFGVAVDLANLQADLQTDDSFLTYQWQPGGPGKAKDRGYGLRVQRALDGPALRLLASLLMAP